MNIQNGVSSVPVYQRWYSSPKMVQAARGRAMVLNLSLIHILRVSRFIPAIILNQGEK